MRDQINDIVDDIYDAAQSPDRWQDVVFKIQKLCPGSHAGVLFYDAVTSKPPWEVSTFIGQQRKEYDTYYKNVNSLWPVMQAQKVGTVSNTDFFDIPIE